MKISDLPEEIKTEALRYQKRDDLVFIDPNSINTFDWEYTPQGYEYWEKLHKACIVKYDFKKKDSLIHTFANEIKEEYKNLNKTDSIVDSVIAQYKERSNFGITKYGTTLDRDDLSPLEWIEHAKQEAMDFTLYLEKLKTVIEKHNKLIENLKL